MIKSNPTPARWVTRLGEQSFQRSTHIVVKVLNPMSGFPAWGSNKGAGNPQESGFEGQQDLIIQLPED